MRCSIVSALAAVALTLAGTAQARADAVQASALQETLTNGLHVVLLPNKLAPVATTIITYSAGSDDDTSPGVAHATEHMLFRGTSDVTAGQFADIAARMGAQYNAQTLNETTLYYFKLPSAYVGVALRLEADRMTNALIRPSDWAAERGPIEQEIQALESIPGYRIGRKVGELFFAGTPFANSPGGTVQSFEKMNSDEIVAFYKRWYHPNNATLIVAGDIDSQATMAQVHELFDPISAAPLPVRPTIKVPPLPASSLQDSMDFPLGIAALMFRLPGSNDADHAAADVLSQVLTSGRGGLADLSAQGKLLAAFSVSNAFPEVGATFLMGIPAQGESPQAAQDAMAGVLDGYRKDGLPDALIDAAKTRLLAEQAYSQSSISGLGFAWAQAMVQKRPSPDDIYAQIDEVSSADVNRVLRTYLTPEHQISVSIAARPGSTMPKPDPNAGVENVQYTPSAHEQLPNWAAIGLKAALNPPRSDRSTMITQLSNGMRLLIRRETVAPSVIVSAVIRMSPTLYEPKGKDGVGVVTAALLPWGTTTYDRIAFQRELDAIAATVRLGGSFGLRVPSKSLDRGLELLADGMLHPAFPASGFSVVKTAVIQSTAATNKLPQQKADLAQRMALYQPGDPRRRDVNEVTVANVTLDDAKRWYDFAYRPDETTLAIVGDVDPAQAEAAVQKFFGDWRAKGPRPTFQYPALRTKLAKNVSVTLKSASVTQSEVTLKQIIDLRRSDADYVPLMLANTMLSGEGTDSMLFQELRTKRSYVYRVESHLDVAPDHAEFAVTFASDPTNVKHAEAAVLAIIRRLQQQPLQIVDLQRAKALLLAQRVLPLDSYDGVSNELLGGAEEGYESGGSDAWFWDALVATTPTQVEHAMRRIGVDRFVRVIVAPE